MDLAMTKLMLADTGAFPYLHIISMSRAVHVSIVAVSSLVLYVGCVDSDLPLTLLRGPVDLIIGPELRTSLFRKNLITGYEA
jgi:hypothetical protein